MKDCIEFSFVNGNHICRIPWNQILSSSIVIIPVLHGITFEVILNRKFNNGITKPITLQLAIYPCAERKLACLLYDRIAASEWRPSVSLSIDINCIKSLQKEISPMIAARRRLDLQIKELMDIQTDSKSSSSSFGRCRTILSLNRVKLRLRLYTAYVIDVFSYLYTSRGKKYRIH